MKHKYRFSIFVVQFLVFSAISLAIFYFFSEQVKEMSHGRRRLDMALIMLPMVLTIFNFLENHGKYVETFSEHVKFNRFRFMSFNVSKVFYVDLRYENIISIESRKLPVIGIYKIIVHAKNFGKPISVPITISKYSELCYELCIKVKRFNSKAYIDSDLEEYVEKKRNG